jgi:transposase
MSNLQGSISRQARTRLQGGDLIERGFDNEEIMAILEVSLSSVQRWRKKVEEKGLHALTRKHGTGQTCRLSKEQLDELKTIIHCGAVAAGYLTDRWTSRIVADLIFKKWSITYSHSQVRKILRDLRLSYQKPDVKSTKHSQEVVDYWRKHEWERIKKSEQRRFDACHRG